MPPYQMDYSYTDTFIYDPNHPYQLEKDDANYRDTLVAINTALGKLSLIKINQRNNEILMTMYADLEHMQKELLSLEARQRTDPYEVI